MTYFLNGIIDIGSLWYALRLFRLPASLNAHMLCTTIPSKERRKGSFPLLGPAEVFFKVGY